MLTRRTFLGTVAALAVSPVASKAAPVAAEPVVPVVGTINTATFPFWRSSAQEAYDALTPEQRRAELDRLFNSCRRDDGDTILELR